MTIVSVDLIGTTLDAAGRSTLARRIIAAFCEIEVGQDVALAHAGFVVQVNESAADSVFMGDSPMVDASSAGRAAIVKIQVMAGPWNDEMKADIFRSLEQIVREVAELPRSGIGADVWMTIVEVPEGGWSTGGRPVSIGKLAPLFTEDRQGRISEYLASRRAVP